MTVSIASDLGGASELSTVQGQLIKRFAGASVVAELTEAAIVAGAKDVDLSRYATLLNASARIAQLVGIQRKPRDVMTLEAYLSSKAAGSPETGEEPDPSEDGAEDG